MRCVLTHPTHPVRALRRRSGGSGYLLPLSGGADSASTAAIVGAMCQVGGMCRPICGGRHAWWEACAGCCPGARGCRCYEHSARSRVVPGAAGPAALRCAHAQMVVRAVEAGDTQVLEDARRIGQYGPGEAVAPTAQVRPCARAPVRVCVRPRAALLAQVPHGCSRSRARCTWPCAPLPAPCSCVCFALCCKQDLAHRLFVTVYMGTVNSSKETRDRCVRVHVHAWPGARYRAWVCKLAGNRLPAVLALSAACACIK